MQSATHSFLDPSGENENSEASQARSSVSQMNERLQSHQTPTNSIDDRRQMFFPQIRNEQLHQQVIDHAAMNIRQTIIPA